MRNKLMWLIEIRKEKGLTQEAVAMLSKISQAYYAQIENGIRGRGLPLNTAKRIADALGFPVENFNQK